MRIHPKANAKGARNRLARHASNKQNGRGKYQQTGLLVSFWRTSQRQVLDRAQPPTLQQGGSPMFTVLLGWTLAAILMSLCGEACGYLQQWVLRLSCRLVAGLPDARCRHQNALPRARAERYKLVKSDGLARCLQTRTFSQSFAFAAR